MLSTISIWSKADEGMWLPHLLQKLNINQMQEMGLKLSAEDIYSINQSSLKDAIVIFGGGCTGEMISSEGLLLTNHHCGYRYIQSHSSTENNYLRDGFWSKSKEEELVTPGLSVQFLVRIEDVTDQFSKKLKDKLSEEQRAEIIKEISIGIIEKAKEGTHYEATVRNYFGGNEFYLLVYERFTDVRLVAAPPVSIGDFGSLTDNWMWPRHKADFSMFRVYMSPDGMPAKYSADNVPYKPKHHLPVSIKGVEEGDYAMIMGYPGSTDRFMTSFGVQEIMDIEHPNRIKIRGKKLELMNQDMEKDPAVRLKYAAKYKGVSNYWKYSIGQLKGLKSLKVVDQKAQIEKDFTAWVNESKKRKKAYGTVLNDIQTTIEARKDINNANQYLSEALLNGNEVISALRSYNSLYKLLQDENIDEKRIDKEIASLKSRADRFFKDYNLDTDKKVSIALYSMYLNDVKKEFQPKSIEIINVEFGGDVEKFINELLSSSIFVDQDKLNTFLAEPNLKDLEQDIAFRFAKGLLEKQSEFRNTNSVLNQKLVRAQRLFIRALREMNPDKIYYPDANFTMRVTYGKVGGYDGMDAVSFSHQTTLKGVMEKEDPNNYEFIVPEKLKTIYENKDYGDYGKNGVMPVCFITNNDITGGNSGSPVIGANGELIGLAFDGNWEAMSGDIAFEPNMQRTVCVDARYLLLIIDKVGGAKNLIEEMDIVK